MTLNDIRKLNWITVEDWSKIPTTSEYSGFIVKEDMNCFIEDMIHDVARKLNLPFSDVYTLIKDENPAFFETKRKIYSISSSIHKDSSQFAMLKKLFKIPDTSKVKKDNVGELIESFYCLSDMDKLRFLESIKIFSVKVTKNEKNLLS